MRAKWTRSYDSIDDRMLAQTGRESDSRKHIVMPINDLRQTGPNREHECLVFEPMGPSLP